MSLHAKLQPSSAARWAGQCPGSVQLEAKFPQAVQSAEAAEGDAAHWVVATVLRGGAYPAAGTLAPNGVILDDDMLDAAEVMVDDVRARSAGAVLHIEERVSIAEVHPDNWGTPDVWWITTQEHGFVTLHLYDYKYGHRFVDAFENWQCLDYATGILELPAPAFPDISHALIKIEINVVQPRNYHPSGMIRRWELTAAELSKYSEELRQRAVEATSPKPWSRVGRECRDCRGRHACQVLQYAADNVADIAGETVAVELPPVAVGVELRMLERAAKLLDARLTGLREQAMFQIRAGTAIPFFQLKQGQAREKWAKPLSEIEVLGELVGQKLTKAEPVTPAQARKLGVPDEVVAAYSFRPPGEFKLVPVTDQDAKRIFGK